MIHVRLNPQTAAAEQVEPIGSQVLAPYEAERVARCEQQRVSAARRAAVRIAGLRAQIKRIDHWLARDAGELAAADAARAGEADAGRFEQPWPVWAYWLAVIAIATLEMWVNKLAFDYTGSDNIGSFALAAFIGMAMLVLSKFTAKLLRQKPWRRDDWIGVWLAGGFNLLVLGLAWFVGMARGTMAHEVAMEKGQAIVPGTGFGFGLIVVLGYAAMLYTSYWFVDPSETREQLDARTARLRPQVDGLCRQREKLAREHNQLIASTRLDLEQLVQDCTQRIMQFRDGNLQHNAQAPAWFRLALPAAVFKPIHLGEMVDTHPRAMDELLAVKP